MGGLLGLQLRCNKEFLANLRVRTLAPLLPARCQPQVVINSNYELAHP